MSYAHMQKRKLLRRFKRLFGAPPMIWHDEAFLQMREEGERDGGYITRTAGPLVAAGKQEEQ